MRSAATPPTEIPPALGRVARFAPAKRARLAATALVHALESDPAFRTMVAARVARVTVARRGDADPIAADPIAADPITAAARALSAPAARADDLLRPPRRRPAGPTIGRGSEQLEREVRALTAKLERSGGRPAARPRRRPVRPGLPEHGSRTTEATAPRAGHPVPELQQRHDAERAPVGSRAGAG